VIEGVGGGETGEKKMRRRGRENIVEKGGLWVRGKMVVTGYESVCRWLECYCRRAR